MDNERIIVNGVYLFEKIIKYESTSIVDTVDMPFLKSYLIVSHGTFSSKN